MSDGFSSEVHIVIKPIRVVGVWPSASDFICDSLPGLGQKSKGFLVGSGVNCMLDLQIPSPHEGQMDCESRSLSGDQPVACFTRVLSCLRLTTRVFCCARFS